MMKKLGKLFKSYTFNIILVVSVTVLVMWLVLKDNAADIFGMLQRANYWYVLLILLMMLLTRVLLGWTLMTEVHLSDPRYNLTQGTINAFIASFFNGITPSSTGGQFAQMYAFRKQGVPVSRSVGVLWMDFIIYQTTMVISVLILILLRFSVFYVRYSQFFIIVLFGFLVNAAVIAGLWAMVRFPSFYTWLTTTGMNIGYKIHIVKDKEKTAANIKRQLSEFQKEVEILRHHKQMILKIAAADLLRLLLYYAVPYYCARALHVDIDISMFIDVLALSSFVSMVNAFIPLPGASGGTEASFILMFSTIFGKINASSIMILWRVMTYYLMLLAGGIVFIYSRTQRDVTCLEESQANESSIAEDEEKTI